MSKEELKKIRNLVDEYKSLCSVEGGNGTKAEKEKLLKQMSDEEIDKLIKWTSNMYGKIWLSSFKKGEEDEQKTR